MAEMTRPVFRRWHRPLSLTIGLGLLVSVQQKVCGQEALSLSLAGEEAAQANKNATASLGYYNLLMGPAALRLASGLGVQYDDNIHLQNTDPQGDFIFRPNVNTQIHWPVTENNSLDVSVGAGYSAYVRNPDLDQFFVNPGSGLSFNIFVGDCEINLHDRVSITQNAYQNPTAGGNGNYAQLENTAGVNTTWDLNKLIAQLGYDHANDISLGSGQQVPDNSSENWFASVGAHVLPEVTVGVEGGVGLMSYDRSQSTSTQPDATQWNAGVFCQAQISEHISGRLDVGYTIYAPSATGAFTNLNSTADYYFQFSLSHQVNQLFNYSLSGGRSTDSSAFGQPFDYYFARVQTGWNIFKNYQLSTPVWWEKGSQLYSLGGTTDYDQYGAGINVGRAITKKLSGNLAYQLIRESSDRATLNYTVNIVSLNFSYQF